MVKIAKNSWGNWENLKWDSSQFPLDSLQNCIYLEFLLQKRFVQGFMEKFDRTINIFKVIVACRQREQLEKCDKGVTVSWDNSAIEVATEQNELPQVRLDVLTGAGSKHEGLGSVGRGENFDELGLNKNYQSAVK